MLHIGPDLSRRRLDVHVMKEFGQTLLVDAWPPDADALRVKGLAPLACKTDRSFVSGLEEDESARRLASAILEMGRALDVTVIAEGVETKGQFTWLDRAGCRCAQGFYFSKPLPATECFDLLSRD